MKTRQRLTFEEGYRDVVYNSAIYELKSEQPKASFTESKNTTHKDRKVLGKLLDDLCYDMSMIFGRRIKRQSELRLVVTNPFDLNWAEVYFEEYSQQIPSLVSRVINGLVSKFVPYTLNAGWVCWSGWNAYVKFPISRYASSSLIFNEAAEIPTDNQVPEHIEKLLQKLKKTKFDYQPYFLTGNSGEKVLALKLGCQWHDLAIARWKPQKTTSNLLIDVALMLTGILGMILSIFFAIKTESLAITIVLFVVGILSTLGASIMGMLVSDHFRHLKV